MRLSRWTIPVAAALLASAATVSVGGLLSASAGHSEEAGRAAERPALLAQHHTAAGIGCDGCHGGRGNPPGPRHPVDTPRCLGCHGSYPAIATATQRLTPNPHASHKGDLPCASCHRAHQPSVDYCSSCHSWGFRVP